MPPKKDNTPLIIGGVVGALVLLIIIIAATSGGDEPVRQNNNGNAANERQFDTTNADGKFDKAMYMLSQVKSKYQAAGRDVVSLKAQAQEIMDLLGAAIQDYGKASSNHAQSRLKKATEALKTVRSIMSEL
jgi:ABC-type protease/lipase transport system fused ATPase/permease subunit